MYKVYNARAQPLVSFLRPWQTRTHCCGHLVATQMFPRLPARATFVADTNFVSGTQKMFLVLFRNSPRNTETPWATMCLRLQGSLYLLFDGLLVAVVVVVWLKCHYDQILDIYLFKFSNTIRLSWISWQISIYWEH